MIIYKSAATVIFSATIIVAMFLGYTEFDRWLIKVNHSTSVREFIDIIRSGSELEKVVVYSCYRKASESVVIFDCFDQGSIAQVDVDFDPVCLRSEEGNNMVGVTQFREQGPVLTYGIFYDLSDDQVRRIWSCGRKPWWLRVK